VMRSISSYDRRKGRFRSWLMAVVRRRLSEFWAASSRQAGGSGDTRVLRRMEQLPSAEDAEQVWDQEYRRSVFQLAVARIRNGFEESTWQAFWQTHVEGKGTREVAQVLGISEGAVYVAKSRVLARLKKQVQAFED
jgi:RNA polymerase sigma factor (sigma-70 family)